MNQSNNGGTWIIIAIVVGIALLGNLLGGGSNNSGTTSVSTPDRSSFEHRYATERFKQEGYSAAESQQAADAITKFHNAQKNR